MNTNAFDIARECRAAPVSGRVQKPFWWRICPLLPTTMLVLLLPLGAKAEFAWTTNNGTITITRWSCSSQPLTIPDTITDLPVTAIADSAFSGCFDVPAITIPDSVTSIGAYAFDHCTNLSHITIGEGVITIGNDAFRFCCLTNVIIPDSVTTIQDEAFYNCTRMGSATIGNGVTNIGNRAFSMCYLRNITVGNSVRSIGDYAFEDSIVVPAITIPNSVVRIGDHAFYFCMGLTNFHIPASVESIGPFAFAGCFSLSSITVDPLNPAYSSDSGTLFDKGMVAVIAYPPASAGTSYVIPSNVIRIADAAFYHCTNLASITIPENISTIGMWTFGECANLTNVSIPSRVSNIADGAFNYCTSLTRITIPATVTNIGDYGFWECTSLSNIYFLGDAPQHGFAAFDSDPGTIYYLPGTLGWGSTYAGLPTKPWFLPNPLILNRGTGFGVGSNGFGFTISWATNTLIVVEAGTKLDVPAWTPITTNTLTSGTSYFSDRAWTNYPSRFYRVRSQ